MDLLAGLRGILAEDRVVTEGEEIERHGGAIFTYHAPRPPDAVVYPKTRAEVVEVLRFADGRGLAVIPFGEGSSLEGHTIPTRGGISLDLGLMAEILEVRPGDFVARVQPGVTHGELNEHLNEHRLFFPVDPGWDASLGGMAATNASGTNAVRYGAMRDQVLGLEVVLADGTVMRTGGMAMKSAAGYNLTGLFVGSEGTLGVFTELILRSEEHTSELQSRQYLVCRLLLEKKKNPLTIFRRSVHTFPSARVYVSRKALLSFFLHPVLALSRLLLALSDASLLYVAFAR